MSWKWCNSICNSFFTSCSAFDGYLEYYRGFPGKQTQLYGSQHRVLSVTFASNTVHHLLPAKQALAHNPPDQCRPVHLVPPQLPVGGLRPVRNPKRFFKIIWCLISCLWQLSWGFVIILTWITVMWPSKCVSWQLCVFLGKEWERSRVSWWRWPWLLSVEGRFWIN